VESFIEIPPLNEEISSREIGVNGQTTYGRTPGGRPLGRPAVITSPPIVGGSTESMTVYCTASVSVSGTRCSWWSESDYSGWSTWSWRRCTAFPRSLWSWCRTGGPYNEQRGYSRQDRCGISTGGCL